MKSNCLIEALKAKLHDPNNVQICKRGSWLSIFKKRWPHFYWYNLKERKHYSFRQKDTLSFCQQLLYNGYIRRF